MNKTMASILAIALLAPATGLAAEIGAPNQGAPNVVFESWDSATRLMILRSGLIEPFSLFGCKVAAEIGIPSTITKGRAVYATYTGPGAGVAGGPSNNTNVCTQISFN